MKKWIVVIGVVLSFLSNRCAQAQNKEATVWMNQLGFYPSAPKIAVVESGTTNEHFYLLNAINSDTVFKGQLSEVRTSKNSGIVTRLADFSAFNKAGNYQLVIKNQPKQHAVSIQNNLHQSVAVASLKAFYYHRVSMPLNAAYAGVWARPAGHPDTAVLIHAAAASFGRPEGTIVKSPGGWYDAGDYNKYIVNSGITMGTLLSAYEDFPEHFKKLKTNIPESNNKVPDILDEVLYNLRWMLTMQDPADGGVYNKCTNAEFDGMVMPGVTKAPRYLVQKSTAATLDFAAVMAQASRVYKNFQSQFPGLADSCLQAAKLAWAWAKQNPQLEYNQNKNNEVFKPAIQTGGYGDKTFTDEWFWAASELLITTKNMAYYADVKKGFEQPATLPSWANVHSLGLFSLYRMQAVLPTAIKQELEAVKDKIMLLANDILAGVNDNAFGVPMGKTARQFNWGSNSNAANQGWVLVLAYRISSQKKYLQAALANMDYLMGRNATGYCFVTGFGSRSPMHPHHRPSEADGIAAPVPGWLVGGPNSGRQDKSTYPFTEPERSFVDDASSYASNEVAINWNAPFVYLANALEALQKELN